ncbi:MAG: hypothetical protein COA94_02160 [Rickettsiales bacterium]|nr:MAG: hypothetical protein COA94_02160 [Rickettsiales bacterium]
MDKWEPTVLVLGSGGMKGFMEIGALVYMSKIGKLNKIDTYVGCSIGAVICLLRICDYDYTEIMKIAYNVDVSKFININLNTIVENMGLINSNDVVSKLETLVESQYGMVPTLEQLYITTGKILTIVTYNMTKSRTEFISRDNMPDISCVDAVMLSCNIPFIFQTIKINGDIYVDGGIGNPYPVDIYDNNKTKILGMYIAEPKPKETTTGFILNLIHCQSREITSRIIKGSSDKCKHIKLISPTTDTTGLSFTHEIRTDLIMIGWNAAIKATRGEVCEVEMEDLMSSIIDNSGEEYYTDPGDSKNTNNKIISDSQSKISVKISNKSLKVLENRKCLDLLNSDPQDNTCQRYI